MRAEAPAASPVQEEAKSSSSSPEELERWRRHSTKYFFLLCFLILVVTLTVHQTILVQDQSSLPIEELVQHLRTYCPVELEERMLTDPPRLRGSGRLMSAEQEGAGRLPTPTAYGVGVWADTEELLAMARATIRVIDERVSAHAPETDAARGVMEEEMREAQYMFPFFRRETRLLDGFLLAHTSPFTTEHEALVALGELAEEQQLGLASLRYAFTPDLTKEMQMSAISLLRLPGRLFPFITDPSRTPTWCHAFDTRQSFCVLLTTESGALYAAPNEAAEVSAAVASVLADDMRIDSFRAEDVHRWHRVRQDTGCLYSVRSLGVLQESVSTHPDMHIPFAVHSVFQRLGELAQRRDLVRAARAADDLQFDPHLTPQLYMPWDHSLLSQLLILLPVVSMCLMSVRFIVDERRVTRRRAAMQAAEAADGATEKKTG